MQMTIVITGTKRIDQKLKRLGSSLYNFKAANAKIGEQAAKYYSTVGFASQGGVFGEPWKPLSTGYRNAKNKRYPGRPPLVASGQMQDSFTYVASSSQVVIGNNSKHFKYHQSTAPRSKMPRRATMGINNPVRQIVRSIIEDDVRTKIRAA